MKTVVRRHEPDDDARLAALRQAEYARALADYEEDQRDFAITWFVRIAFSFFLVCGIIATGLILS